MPSQKNITDLKFFNEKKEKAKSTVFADFKGLSVNQINSLRQQIRNQGGEMLVVKNTLVKIAFQKDELSQLLSGPTATIFAYEDEIAPLKVIAEFKKTNELPQFKAGYIDDKVLNSEELNQLSLLPGKQELRGKLVNILNAPISGIVNVLQGSLRKFVYTLSAIKDQKAQSI